MEDVTLMTGADGVQRERSVCSWLTGEQRKKHKAST